MPAMASANAELERSAPSSFADPGAAHEGDAELLDPQLMSDIDGPYVEMVRRAPCATLASLRLMAPACARQDLHCGIFEKVEADADAYSGSESDASEDAEPLRLPPTHTAAVAKAKAAGRTLICEVGALGEAAPAEGASEALPAPAQRVSGAAPAPAQGRSGVASEEQTRGLLPTKGEAAASGATRPKRSSKRASADAVGAGAGRQYK